MSIEQKYVVTQDTRSLFKEVDSDIADSSGEQFLQTSEQYFNRIQQILDSAFPDMQVVGFTESVIEQKLTNRVEPYLTSDAACICLDRFLLKKVEEGEAGNQFYRFGICRTSNGERETRQGKPNFAKQFQDLQRKIPDIQSRKTVIVDDGLFTGGTVKEFIELADQNGISLNVEKIIGFLGDAQVQDDRTELVEPIDDLYEWIDIRDFSPMGGKLLNRGNSNRVSTAIPYLYPWSDGKSASLDMSPDFFDVSTSMIREFQAVVRSYDDSSGNSLTFRKLVKSGFPLPTNVNKTIPVSINDSVTEYLDRCVRQIETERNRTVDIYDMDGTLYQLDGANNGFRGSSLEREVQKNALAFIKIQESCSDSEAQVVLRQGLQDPVGLSRFLAGKYGITRDEYFNISWNINPEQIVKNFENAVAVLQNNKQYNPEGKMILLTAAPNIWAKNVLAFLGVDNCFEVQYTGEQFQSKEEIFRMLAKRYKPGRMISIGDQDETDILPAQKYGITTLKINNPDYIEQMRDFGLIASH